MTYKFTRQDKNYFYCEGCPDFLIHRNWFWQPYTVIWKGKVMFSSYGFIDAASAVLRLNGVLDTVLEFNLTYEDE